MWFVAYLAVTSVAAYEFGAQGTVVVLVLGFAFLAWQGAKG
jgi:hypothetical protein